MNTLPSGRHSITSGGATGLRSPITTLPHGMLSPSEMNRIPYDPSSCLERSLAVAESNYPYGGAGPTNS